jgi:hypothetical protein
MLTENHEVKRVFGRPFQKGNRANPGGRPKLAKGFAEWCREQFETPEGRELLKKRMQKSDYVLTKLLGYAYGEPKAQIDHAGSIVVRFVDDWRSDG